MIAKNSTLALAVVTLFACASHQPSVTPHLQVERVVVAPLNLAVHCPEELEGQHEPVWRELVQFLQSQNQRISVLDPGNARLIWEGVMADMARSDTPPALAAALANFARRMSGEAGYDLLVIPSLVLRRAHIDGEVAIWDGVRRHLSLLTPAEFGSYHLGSHIVSNRGFRGSVSAASLHVTMLDPNGETVFDGLGGLALIEAAGRDARGPGRPWSLALREHPFDIPAHLREGIRRAFEQERKVRSAVAR